jgi:outer membrane protein TolC
MQYSKKLIMLLVAVAALSGCAIEPEPIKANERLASMLEDQKEIYTKQEPITAPLTFYDALARALKYNFDHRLTMMEAVLQDTQLDVATLNMLPRLAINAGYLDRQAQLGSSSVDYFNRDRSAQLAQYSTSQDASRGVADLAFTWNVLDFGVSYYQAKQQANRVLIAQERRRKVVNNLIKEVLNAYWGANIADRLLPKLDPVLTQAQHALELSKSVEVNRLQPPLSVLEYQRSLLRIIDQLKKLKADLLVAKPKLAGLINAPMHSDFKLAQPKQTPEPPVLKATMVELENLGLFYRPELREEMYQERISHDEAWKEMLKVLPGLTIPISANWDSNSFLLYNMWMEAGARTTFNLVNLLAAPKMWKSAQTQIEVAKTRRRALSVATLVQVNVSYLQYMKALDSYHSADELNKVDQGIFKVVTDTTESDAGSELERVHAATAALASQLEKEQSLSEIYAALGNIYASIGIDPAVDNIENVTVRTLSVQLEKSLDHWYKGEFPKLPNAPNTATITNKEITPTQMLNTQTPPPVSVKATSAPTTVASNTDKPVNTPETSATEYYAIQLMASDKESDVVHFMEKWRADLSSPTVVDMSKSSKPLFVLVSGNYSSRSDAQHALDNLAPELKANRRNRLLPVKIIDNVLVSSLD